MNFLENPLLFGVCFVTAHTRAPKLETMGFMPGACIALQQMCVQVEDASDQPAALTEEQLRHVLHSIKV